MDTKSSLDTYQARMVCSNCDFDGQVELKCGTKVSDHKKCPNCLCDTLSKYVSYKLNLIPKDKPADYVPWWQISPPAQPIYRKKEWNSPLQFFSNICGKSIA